MRDINKLRRIALQQQGLLKTHPFGRGKAATLRAIEQISYVQIDTISVVERAHHHVLWSRIPDYQPQYLTQLVADRAVFEYWSHAAAWLPMNSYRFALPRMLEMKAGKGHWSQSKDEQLMHAILARIRSDGPLRSRDFEDTRKGNKEWWSWKPAKQALEQLFMQGDLMVSKRVGFQKVYDLAERVLPENINTTPPTLHEYAGYLVDTNLRAHGFATQKTMSYLRRGKDLRNAISDVLKERIDSQSLTCFELTTADVAYINPNLLERRLPYCPATVKILSPFDNALIQRERGQAVFNFDYKIECYVPAAKRQYGYFCLPLLYRDQLVGRIDCKAHRKERRLEVIKQYIEHPVDSSFNEALHISLDGFARFNQCEEVFFS